MNSDYKSYIIYVGDLENKFHKNPLDIISDFLSNDMQIILKENLFFTEVAEHINPKEWFEEDNETVFEDYYVNFYYIDLFQSPQSDYSICMYYDDIDNSFNLGYDGSIEHKDYLFFVVLYNFVKKMILLESIEIQNRENGSTNSTLIKTKEDIALFFDNDLHSKNYKGNVSFSEFYGFGKSSDMIKYLAVPYTDAIKIKGFPKEWLI